MSISTFLERAILQKVFRRENFDVTQVFISLHTGDPGRDGKAELSGGGYKRQPSSFDQNLRNITNLEFRDLHRGTVTHAGLWDARDGGHFLWGTDLGERHEIGEGWDFKIRPGLISSPTIR